VLATVAVSDVFRKLFHAGAVLGAQYMLAARSVDRNQLKIGDKLSCIFLLGTPRPAGPMLVQQLVSSRCGRLFCFCSSCYSARSTAGGSSSSSSSSSR
jgi:hypothetical protein